MSRTIKKPRTKPKKINKKKEKLKKVLASQGEDTIWDGC